MRAVRQSLAGTALAPSQAKLYSQRLRLNTGQPGLASFAAGDVEGHLDEAMLLIHCGLLEARNTRSGDWRHGIKRAAEILEWLSQPGLAPSEVPLGLLAAAAYQLAGYPAMALGHLKRIPEDQASSKLLYRLLRADFLGALKAVLEFWKVQHGQPNGETAANLTADTYKHVVMCIGTICAYLSTGEDANAQRALDKLDRLAPSLLHSHDPYSYLLASLTAASCRRYVETCLWPQIQTLRTTSSSAAGNALEQFARSAFTNGRALVWPAQAAGIERLCNDSSFVLCTPTGSGKTTVATLAVIKALFADRGADPSDSAGLGFGNVALYLVPTRALAAEVESRLAKDLNGIAAAPVTVTGLYGGADWGPTDVWTQNDRATVVICTFEKADALLRYLGALFLSRVRLVVVDEAHMVEQDRARIDGFEDGTSRALRLEQLGTRLLRAREEFGFRVIALSAVAGRAAPALARWITGTPDASATTSGHRSTRQMLGRLEVNAAGGYTLRNDLMDGRSLRFSDENADATPFVPSPIPPLPSGVDQGEGPEVCMRAPTLWAALHLAAEGHNGSTQSVLISLTQGVAAFASTCADLMDTWSNDLLLNYGAFDEANDLWVRCLASAADYFTEESVEYRLLRRGIAVHHGKMPGLLARRLRAVIDDGLVRVIIATSTLSEGVNTPVSFLLMPNLYRGAEGITLQEFTNLCGRAGRPGIATEGSVVVVLLKGMRHDRQRNHYTQLVADVERTAAAAGEGVSEDRASSPLAQLLHALEKPWLELSSGGPEEFADWLEQTVVVGTNEEADSPFGYLDSLDAFLIAAVQEIEEIRGELPPSQLEGALTEIWQRTYAFAAAEDQDRLARVWLARGRAIKVHYPDPVQRRRIFRTGLSPRSATVLFGLAENIRAKLSDGAAYARWAPEERFGFIRDVLALLSQVPSFRIKEGFGPRRNFHPWPNLLRWWLAKTTLSAQPLPKDIPKWYDFVAGNFIYRGAWGLGSVIGLLLDATDDGQPVHALSISDWPRCGLPWIAFWIKDLITWGTLDPVAAYLLARGNAIDRPHAEEDATAYYRALPQDIDANDVLDPRTVLDWASSRCTRPTVTDSVRSFSVVVRLARAPGDYVVPVLAVWPLEDAGRIIWVDPAGYEVARSGKPESWPEEPADFDFRLDVANATIQMKPYLAYR